MKKFLGFVVVSGAMAMASARPAGVSPNLYTCEGAEASFNYSTSSFAGYPTVNVTFSGETVRLPSKPEITMERTRAGKLVSVSDMHLVPLDGPEVRYSIILPEVRVEGMGKPQEFNSIVIRTVFSNPFFHAPVMGGEVVGRNQFSPVKCRAELVNF